MGVSGKREGTNEMAIHERFCERYDEVGTDGKRACYRPYSRRYKINGVWRYLCPDCAAELKSTVPEAGSTMPDSTRGEESQERVPCPSCDAPVGHRPDCPRTLVSVVERMPCEHRSIITSPLRVCMDCGEPNPKRGRRRA